MTLYISKRPNNQKYLVNAPIGVNELQSVNEEKDIGVVIDFSLKFELHIAENIKKCK